MSSDIIGNKNITIVDFKPEHKKAFRDLNIHWISEHFEIEEADYQALDHPEETILKNGGCILLAMIDEEVVGTCALMNEGHGIYELTKMTVAKNFRGLKIGKQLGLASIDRARKLNAKKLILYSNTIHNGLAIELYRKLGFKEIPMDSSVWVRANIKMEIGF